MGKFYWLKLKTSFFKRHDIRIVESLPNGKEIVYFFLKLMVESVDHEGELRFSEDIPYSNQMLSVLTDTEVEFVEEALVTLTQYGMIEILEDRTISIPKVEEMIGSASDTDASNRMRRMRARRAKEGNSDNVTECYEQNVRNKTNELQSVTNNLLREIEIEKEIDKEIEIDKEKIIKEKTQKRFSKPSLSEISEYCNERQNNVNPEEFFDYYEANGWKVGKNPMKDWKSAVRYWEQKSRNASPKPKTFNPFTELKRKEGMT